MNAKLIIGYRCSNCNLIHEDYGEADNCCPTESLDAYQCSECGSIYSDDEEAEECCE